MIAVVAALPREIAGLVRGKQAETEWLPQGVHLYRLSRALVVAAGMGKERATVAIRAALQAGGVTELISVGLAGSCNQHLGAGEIVEADAVVDEGTGECFPSRVDAQVILVTTATIASVQEKARLAASYGAAMVDMEAATVARLAQAHGLEFRAIKGISDAHDFELASLAKFAGKQGSFRTSAFALHTALRPHSWPKAMRLGRGSARALAALNERLQGLLTDAAA